MNPAALARSERPVHVPVPPNAAYFLAYALLGWLKKGLTVLRIAMRAPEAPAPSGGQDVDKVNRLPEG